MDTIERYILKNKNERFGLYIDGTIPNDIKSNTKWIKLLQIAQTEKFLKYLNNASVGISISFGTYAKSKIINSFLYIQLKSTKLVFERRILVLCIMFVLFVTLLYFLRNNQTKKTKPLYQYSYY